MTEIKGLGYLRVQTQDVPRWRELVVAGLGFATWAGPNPDALYLRMDERRARLIVLPGDVDKVQAIGWEVRDQFALARVRQAVEKAGIEVELLSEAESTARNAEQVLSFADPSGTTIGCSSRPSWTTVRWSPPSAANSSPERGGWVTWCCPPRRRRRPWTFIPRCWDSCPAAR